MTVGEVDEGGGGERGREERESYERSLATNSANCPLGAREHRPQHRQWQNYAIRFYYSTQDVRMIQPRFSEVLKFFKKMFQKTHNPNWIGKCSHVCFGGRNVVNYRQLTIPNETMNDTTSDATRLEMGYRRRRPDRISSPEPDRREASSRHVPTSPSGSTHRAGSSLGCDSTSYHHCMETTHSLQPNYIDISHN